MATSPPPTYTARPPPSGYRIPLSTTQPFPARLEDLRAGTHPPTLGTPVCTDLDGSPVYIGSALFDDSVHPCKIGAHLQTYAAVAYGGGELSHNGRYDLLPYLPDQMEWVPTRDGKLPEGRRVVEGGYESSGAKLYHALGVVNGVKVPGKAGEHLGGANLPFGGQEHVVREYEVLCWR
ncbi:hypothetical protein FB107DRAFT_287787 [Schizophyllum commune]